LRAIRQQMLAIGCGIVAEKSFPQLQFLTLENFRHDQDGPTQFDDVARGTYLARGLWPNELQSLALTVPF